jgi:hypothetical protein
VPRGSSGVWRSRYGRGSTAEWQNSIQATAQRSWAKRQKAGQCQKDLPRTISTRYRVRATVNPSLLQGRQAHATAANTAIITKCCMYIARIAYSRAYSFSTLSFLPRPFLSPASLSLPTSCRRRRTRTHFCEPSRPSRGPAASAVAAACAFGCPRGRAKPASAVTLRSIYATPTTKMARVAGIEDFQVERQWSCSGRTS